MVLFIFLQAVIIFWIAIAKYIYLTLVQLQKLIIIRLNNERNRSWMCAHVCNTWQLQLKLLGDVAAFICEIFYHFILYLFYFFSL